MVTKKPHIYNIGEIVNDSLKIIEQIREVNGKKYKGYVVQSVKYPDAPTYNILESNLSQGQGDGYVRGVRVFEGNSFYSIKHLRQYVVDIEKAKQVTPGSNKKIEFKCPSCDRIKIETPNRIVDRGFYCPTCSTNTSYPELFFTAYLEVKNIEYEYQARVDSLEKHIFDFKIIIDNEVYFVETHGEQHYRKQIGYMCHEKTVNSDNTKRKYCIDNNFNFIELDCRKSDFKLIKEEVDKNIYLENITEREEEKMLEIIEKNKRYDTKNIIKMYQDGESLTSIGKYYNIDCGTVRNVLVRNNIETRGSKKKIECTTTGEIFNSSVEAAEHYGITVGCIRRVCRGERKTTGNLNGTPLKWRWID